MMKQKIRGYLKRRKRMAINMLYLTAASVLILPQYALAASKKKEDTPVDPYALADNASAFVTYVASAFAAGIGTYVLIGGIQEFSQARESHDTSTQMKAVAKVMAGVVAALAGGVAAWLKANTK